MNTIEYKTMSMKQLKQIIADFDNSKEEYLHVKVSNNVRTPEKYLEIVKTRGIALEVPNPTEELDARCKYVLLMSKRTNRVKEVLSKSQGVKSSTGSRREGSVVENAVHKDSGSYQISHLLHLLNRRSEDWVRYGDWEESSDGLFGFIPKFQRDSVWTLQQKRDLIMSMLREIPIGSFYVNELQSDNYSDSSQMEELDTILYDGQQRFLAIKEFLEGEFSLEVSGEELYVGDLSIKDVVKINSTLVSVYTTNISNLDDLIDFYEIINVGGTSHTEEDILKARQYKTKR